VLNSHGATKWITLNTVANLLVAHTGPVVVGHNRAKGSMRCIANTRQRGRGNTAHGRNTCPR
jgi:hypothetical protein